MAKIVLSQNPLIKFEEIEPIVILDHRFERQNGEIVFTYRVKFVTSSTDILDRIVEVRFSNISPYKAKPKMFKGSNVSTTKSTLEAIKKYNEKRLSVTNTKNETIARKAIEYHDIQRGYVDLDVTINNTGQQQIYSYFVSTDYINEEILATYEFENSSIINKYELPYEDFSFKTQQVSSGKRRVLISSRDKRISSFIISSRNISGADQGQFDEVSKPLTANVKNGQAFLDVDDTGSIKKSYRVSPVSFVTKTQLAQFKEEIVNINAGNSTQCLIYPESLSSQSAAIKVTSIPENVIAIGILRKNITQRELQYSTIYTQRSSGPGGFSYRDSLITPYNSYDYKLLLEFQDGSKLSSAANYTANPVLLDDVVAFDSKIMFSKFVNEITTCIFSANVTYKTPSNTTRVLNDLKSLGIDNIYPNEIKNLSTQLDPLIGILVSRISLKTGFEEKIGIYKPGEITVSTKDTVDHVYILEVCLRSPSDVIEEIATSSDFAGQQGQFNPRSITVTSKILGSDPSKYTSNFTQKFFNRRALSRGQLAYGKTLSTSSAGIEAGRTGILTSHLIKNVKVVPTIISREIISRSDGLIIRWDGSNLEDVVGFEVFDGTGKSVKCNVNKDLSSYCATIKTDQDHVTLKTYTNYGDIIATEFKK